MDFVHVGKSRRKRRHVRAHHQQDRRPHGFQRLGESGKVDDVAGTLLVDHQQRLAAQVLPRPSRLGKAGTIGEVRLLHPAKFTLCPAFAQAPEGQQEERVIAVGTQVG